jgi:hypothetical protein
LTADKETAPAGEVAGAVSGGKGYKMLEQYYQTTLVVVVKASFGSNGKVAK